MKSKNPKKRTFKINENLKTKKNKRLYLKTENSFLKRKLKRGLQLKPSLVSQIVYCKYKVYFFIMQMFYFIFLMFDVFVDRYILLCPDFISISISFLSMFIILPFVAFISDVPAK